MTTTVHTTAAENRPVEWLPVDYDRFNEMLCALPPEAMNGGAFLVGEPADHYSISGAPRFQAYRQVGNECHASSRPMTVAEFKELA